MKTVYKYEMQYGLTVVHLPKAAIPVFFGLQGGTPMLWVETQKGDEDKHPRIFYLFGTGYDIDDDLSYIGTIQQQGYVWHLYEQVVRY